MITKITGFNAHQTPEGMRIAYTYSVLDEHGNLIKSNQRCTIVVMDNEINANIDQINNWLISKIPQ